MNEDMGCGKTLQGMGVPEGFFVQMVMNRTGRDVRDIYMDASAVKYRNIVMCPPHLVKKMGGSDQSGYPLCESNDHTGNQGTMQAEKTGKRKNQQGILYHEQGNRTYVRGAWTALYGMLTEKIFHV